MDADLFDMGKSCHMVYTVHIYILYIVFVYDDYTKTFIDIKTKLRLFIYIIKTGKV